MRATKVNKVILNCLYLAGVLSVALVAPNAVKLFAKSKKKPRLDSVKRAFDRLKSSGYINVVDGNAGLTAKGNLLLGGESIYEFGKTKKWDGKFRVIIFDIPERRRSSRVKLRAILSDIGFIRLQDSVWVYPYNCAELIVMLKADFKIGKDILYMTVDEIENDSSVRKHFGL